MTEIHSLNVILERLEAGTYTEKDITTLRQLLTVTGDSNVVQLGKYNIKINHAQGVVEIGDRIYQGASAESIKKILQEVLQQQNKKLPTQLTGVDALGILSNVPERPLNFLPRNDDLESIKAKILKRTNQALMVTGTTGKLSIQGMGGIGKSVLAAEIARDEAVRRAFPNGILWVTLGQEPKLEVRQAQVARLLTGEAIDFKDVQDGRAELSKILADKVCLLILDDAWKLEHVEAFNILGQDCQLLITTRDGGLINALGTFEHRLDVLNKQQALHLLAKSSGQALETLPPSALEVAKECGNLPLALAMVGAMAQGKPERWKGLLERLRKADLEKIKREFPDYPYPNLFKAIQVSVDFLEAYERERYLDFAVFPEDTSIPLAVLQTFWEAGGLDDLEVDEVVETLVNKSLVQKDKSGHFVLHDLQLDYVLKQVDDLSNLHRRLLQAYKVKSPQGWANSPKDGYFFEKIGYHFVNSGFQQEFRELLLDFQWLQTKLEATNVYALIADFNHFLDDAELSIIKKALELSAHVLTQEPKQLWTQLQGRLMAITSVAIENFLKQKVFSPQFRTLTPSLVQTNAYLLSIFIGHSDHVKTLAVSNDGKYILSGSSDKNMKLWDLETGKQIYTFEGHQGIIRAVFFISKQQAVSAAEDGTLKLWDLESCECLHTFEGHTSPIYTATFIAERMQVISGSADGILKIWDLQNREFIYSFQAHKSSINAIAVYCEEMQAISASSDKTFKLWDLENKKCISTFKGHSGSVYAVAILTTQRQIISTSADRTIKLWDLQKCKCLYTFKGHKGSVYSITLYADQTRFISSSSDKTLKLWNLQKKDCELTLKDNDWANDIAIIPSYEHLIVASDDYTLKLWSLKDEKCEVAIEGHNSAVTALVMTTDGKYVLSSSEDKTVKLWNLSNGKCKLRLTDHNDVVSAIAVTKDGKQAILASFNSALILWDLSSKHNNKRILPIHPDIPTTAISFIPTSRELILLASGNILWLLNINNFELKFFPEIHSGIIKALKVTADGKKAITTATDGQLILWDMEKETCERTLKTEDGLVTAVAITPDGKWGMTALDDNSLKVWNLKKARVESTLLGHSDWIYDVAITPNHKHAVSVSHDKTLRLWDLEHNEMITRFYGESAMQTCAITPDAKRIVAGEQSGRLHFLTLSGEY